MVFGRVAKMFTRSIPVFMYHHLHYYSGVPRLVALSRAVLVFCKAPWILLLPRASRLWPWRDMSGKMSFIGPHEGLVVDTYTLLTAFCCHFGMGLKRSAYTMKSCARSLDTITDRDVCRCNARIIFVETPAK